MGLFLKKSIDQAIADAHDPNAGEGGKPVLARHLSGLNLTLLGVGAIIGAGISR